MVLGHSNNNKDGEILNTHLNSDGNLWNIIHVPGGGSRVPPSHQMLNEGLQYLKMQGNEVFKYAVRTMVESANHILKSKGMTTKDIDWFIPHQANIRIMKTVAERLEIPLEKVIITVHKYGNISAASIPVTLDEAVRSGQIKRGNLILVNSFGAGLTWGASLFRF